MRKGNHLTNKTTKSIALTIDTVVKVQEFQEAKEINSFSNAVEQLCKFGCKAYELKPNLQDPEFVKKWEDLKNKENIFNWVKDLPENVKMAMKTAIEMDLSGENNPKPYG